MEQQLVKVFETCLNYHFEKMCDFLRNMRERRGWGEFVFMFVFAVYGRFKKN